MRTRPIYVGSDIVLPERVEFNVNIARDKTFIFRSLMAKVACRLHIYACPVLRLAANLWRC